MKNCIEEHTLFKSLILHLLPGLLGGIGYYSLVPLVSKYGFPSVMALLLSGIFILIPFELGFLLYEKRKTGKNLLNGIIKYTIPIKKWQYFFWVPLTFILSGLAFKIFGFTSNFIMPIFKWLPTKLFLNMGLNIEYSISKLIITYCFYLFFMVLFLPITEELYFRGYLLPRMPVKLKGWTEILHSGLFALYHTWTLWLFITRTIALFPLVYIVKRKQNVYIGIIAHCMVNVIDFIIGLVFILRMI